MASGQAGSAMLKPSFAKVAASNYKPHNPGAEKPSVVDASAAISNSNGAGDKSPVKQQSPPPPTKASIPNIAMRPKQPVVMPSEQPSACAELRKDGDGGCGSQSNLEQPAPLATVATKATAAPSRAAAEDAALQTTTTQPTASDATATDDTASHGSSCGSAAKAASVIDDGAKSVTSGATTFAMLDEKESLRPDDSASARAADDETDAGSIAAPLAGGPAVPHFGATPVVIGSAGPAAGPGGATGAATAAPCAAAAVRPDLREGSDNAVRAFRDQLQEIATIGGGAAQSSSGNGGVTGGAPGGGGRPAGAPVVANGGGSATGVGGGTAQRPGLPVKLASSGSSANGAGHAGAGGVAQAGGPGGAGSGGAASGAAGAGGGPGPGGGIAGGQAAVSMNMMAGGMGGVPMAAPGTVVAAGEAEPGKPDVQLLEALFSPRDRLFVLKLEQDIIDFINNSNESKLDLPSCNSFYRMLAHRLATYYSLEHPTDDSLKAVRLLKRGPISDMPPPISTLANPSAVSNTPPPAVQTKKIMRRGGDGATPSGSNTAANSENPSKATSEVGGESGSDGGGGGQAAANSTEPKPAAGPITREEKEARYREARQRIFGTAEASESPKDGENTNANNNASEAKDVSRSSSTTGRKKNGPNSGAKKRNYNDDGFEARSQFNSFYPPGAMGPYAVQATYQSQTPDGVWYGGQYPGVAMSGVPPPHFPNMQYGNSMAPPMIGQDPSQQDYSQWQGQPYVEANGGYGGGQGFPGPANGYSTPNSYNPSAFQRGIPPQFQGPPANSSPRGAQAMAMKSSGTPGPAANQAQGHGSHQQHHTSGGEGAHQPWGQMPQYMGAGGPYPMDASGQQPQPWMHQTGGQQQPGGGQQPPNSFMPHQSAPPYLPPYGHQMPPHSHSTTPFAPNHKFRGPPTNPHHPLPGSYNRPQFNPQSQAFVPGGGPRSVSQPPHQPSSSPLAQPTMTAAASPYGLPAKPHVSSAPPLSNGAQQQRHQGMNGFAASGHRTPRMSPPHASYPVVSGGGAPGAVGPQPFATTGPARLLQPQQPQTMQQAQQHRKQSPLTHPLPAGPVVATSTASAPGGRGPTSGGGAGGNGRNASGGGTNSGRGTPLQKGGAALQQGQGPEQGLTPVVASSTAATPSSTSANSAASGTSNNNNPTAAPQQQQHHSSIAKWGTPSNLPPKPPPPVNSQLPPKFLPGMYPGGAKGPPGSFASAANAAAVAAAAAAVGGGAVPGVNSGNGGSSAGYGGQGVVGGKK